MIYKKADDVFEKTVGNTFFLFKPGIEGFYGFEGLGRKLWIAITSGVPLKRIIKEIAIEYDVSIEKASHDIKMFLKDLREQDLVIPRE